MADESKMYFKKYRSGQLTNGMERSAHRALLYSMGIESEDFKKPMIAIVNSFTEMVPGHIHLRELADFVKQGVIEAGGLPREFNTIALCDGLCQGHKGMSYPLPSREIIADSIEMMINAQKLDGMVLIGGCDKIVPAMIMAALRINIPTIIVTGGPMLPGEYQGRKFATYELKEMTGKLLSGEIQPDEYEYMEGLMSPGPGSCAMMGSASAGAARNSWC